MIVDQMTFDNEKNQIEKDRELQWQQMKTIKYYSSIFI